eukprot:gene2457-5391_t
MFRSGFAIHHQSRNRHKFEYHEEPGGYHPISKIWEISTCLNFKFADQIHLAVFNSYQEGSFHNKGDASDLGQYNEDVRETTESAQGSCGLTLAAIAVVVMDSTREKMCFKRDPSVTSMCRGDSLQQRHRCHSM